MNDNRLAWKHTSKFSTVTPGSHNGGSSNENVLSWDCRASGVGPVGVPGSDVRRLIVVSVGVGESEAEELVVAVDNDEGKGVDCLPVFLLKPLSMVRCQGDGLLSFAGLVYK